MFADGIGNTGTVSGRRTAIHITVNVGGLFSGGISNAGTISATRTGTGDAIFISGGGVFSGGIVNAASGKIVGFTAIALDNAGTFLGGISNAGVISGAGSDHAIFVRSTLFSGSIVNSSGGRILAGDTQNAIWVDGVSTFLGGISNAGVISAGIGIDIIGTSGVRHF